jgi:uncharacterized membrane protein YfcA
MVDTLYLPVLIFVAATLYSSVGQAGASGYLAAMALCGVAPAAMRPTALTLNVLVATVATLRFYRASCFSPSLFWPFAAASIPFAFLGGRLTLPAHFYKPLLGLILLFAAGCLLWNSRAGATPPVPRPVPLLPALLSGAGIGILSGLTGAGGGIFLSPLLLLMGWADSRESAGSAAAFNLVNSLAGLVGAYANFESLPATVTLWAGAALVGALIGSELGSRRLGGTALQRLLATVLIVAGGKLVLEV